MIQGTVSASFGVWLKQQRIALDMTQADLASCVGCSVATIRKIESDERRPSRQIAGLLANCLQISPAEQPTFIKMARGEVTTAPLRSHGGLTAVNNLPPQPTTPLLGREVELREITRLLQEPTCRLLTLVGPGGIGKTRLALEIAVAQRAAFQDGACFVSLASVGTPEVMTASLAEGLRIPLSGTADLQTQLLAYLQPKEMLLIVDNMEHLLAGVDVLTALVQAAPAVKLLVTSRERLNVQGEWVFEVRGLLAPLTEQAEALESYSAIDLFVRSARRASADFALTPENKTAVVRICQLMEGVPLGIELAAAWVRLLACDEIVREIERSFDFLTSFNRDIPERQRSMGAAFEHSWNLISDVEKRGLRRLTVFRGGFTRRAAAEVAGVNLPLLAALADKSLITQAGNGRYTQHELIRQYAAAHLQANPQEAQQTQTQFSRYYLGLLQEYVPRLTSDQQKEALAELGADLDNIRAAWETAVAQQQIDLLNQSAWPIYYFYELHNYFQEAEALFASAANVMAKRLAALPNDAADQERSVLEGGLGNMQCHRAFFQFRSGQMKTAVAGYRENIPRLRQSSDTLAVAHGLLHYGFMCWITGERKEAARILAEGEPLGQSLENLWLRANYQAALGALAHELGAYAEAYRQLYESVQTAQTGGDPHLVSFCVSLFSRTAQALGQTAETEGVLHAGLALAEGSGDRWSLGMRWERMAVAAQARGEQAEARQLFADCVALFTEIGDQWSLARALNLYGRFALEAGDNMLARDSFLRAGRAALAAHVVPFVLDALTGLAALLVREEEDKAAVEILQHVRQHPAVPHEAKNRADQLWRELNQRDLVCQIEQNPPTFQEMVAQVFSL
ncbi:MAG: hypothetical protein CL608_14050 [Anaerolineaceae bacterium]|nr:hypothetical protein [Anaerolineaceae bacterium]